MSTFSGCGENLNLRHNNIIWECHVDISSHYNTLQDYEICLDTLRRIHTILGRTAPPKICRDKFNEIFLYFSLHCGVCCMRCEMWDLTAKFLKIPALWNVTSCGLLDRYLYTGCSSEFLALSGYRKSDRSKPCPLFITTLVRFLHRREIPLLNVWFIFLSSILRRLRLY